MVAMTRIGLTIALLAASAAAQWQPQESHTKESLRGLSVWNENVVWASGTHGTYVVTRDGGKTWKAGQVPGAEQLDFRDVETFGETAYLLAAGPGEKSKIYKTSDGGAHWELQFANHEPKGFFDCMAFWDKDHGIAVGDPVNGRFQIITTSDGKTWKLNDGAKMPAAIEGEGAFAASGTCIAVQGKTNAWFVTGGKAARVFRSRDRGKSWQVADTPIVHGPAAAGIFSVAFWDAKHGVIAGGDYEHPEQDGTNLASTEDGGRSWTAASVESQKYFSDVTFIDKYELVVVGTTGRGWLIQWRKHSVDLRWQEGGFNAVAADHRARIGWAVGANGSIARFDLRLPSPALKKP